MLSYSCFSIHIRALIWLVTVGLTQYVPVYFHQVHPIDPAVICKNKNMIFINALLEVDLFGQCNAESLDQARFSGVGGQLDFAGGACNEKGGKSILAFYSTAKNGEVSRIVPRLAKGTMVTTPRTICAPNTASSGSKENQPAREPLRSSASPIPPSGMTCSGRPKTCCLYR